MSIFSRFIAPLAIFSLSTSPTLGQISTDNTLPTSIIQSGDLWEITGGSQAGGNLFHSFTQFSILNGGEVWFNNAPEIQNIISRVTGGGISRIDGVVRANGDANLFLLNPSGIVFGSNASLNLGGSFVGSTADSIVFSDGTSFSTNPTDNPPLLTISIPLGVQFGANPAPIQVQPEDSLSPSTVLQVAPGKTLALIGGEIDIQNSVLLAEDGLVELGSIGSNSLVSLDESSQGFSLGYESTNNFGDIQLQQSFLDVSGLGGGKVQLRGRQVDLVDSGIFAETFDLDTGGNITLHGEQLNITNSAVQSITNSPARGGDVVLKADTVNVQGAFAVVSTETSNEGAGGDINIQATEVTLGDLSLLGTQTVGMGNGGNLTIETETLRVENGSQALVNTFSPGSGGELTVNAQEYVELIGIGNLEGNIIQSALLAEVNHSGSSGGITLITDQLTILDGAQIAATTFNSADAGNVIIRAEEIFLRGFSSLSSSGIFSSVELGATGNGGNVNLTTETLSIQQGAQIAASTFDAGNAGSLVISVGELLEVSGEAQDAFVTGLFTQVQSIAIGNGGSIDIETSQLTLKGNQAIISVSSAGDGMGGDANIATEQLIIQNGGRIQAATIGQGAGGTLNITATDSIQLIGDSSNSEINQSPGGLFTSALGDANAGNLTIITEDLSIKDGAVISASSTSEGEGGTINITASDVVEITGTSNGGRSSGLFVEATGAGRAGTINLSANSVVLDQQGAITAATALDDGGSINLTVSDNLLLRNNSLISATAGTASGNGNGGNINLDTGFVIAVPRENSDIIANAFFGRGGNINIKASSIFGIEFRNQQTSLSDITASSQFGIAGVVEITTIDTEAIKELIEFPTNTVNLENLIVQGCNADGDNVAVSSLSIIGRGGLPPSPNKLESITPTLPDLGSNNSNDNSNLVSGNPPEVFHPQPTQIVEAQGWIINERGNIELVASSTDINDSAFIGTSTDCHSDS